MNPTTIAASLLTDRVNRIEFSATLAAATEADRMKAAGIDLVDFGAGEPHFPTPAHIKQAAIEAIHRDCTKYTPVGGVTPLRKAICERHAQDFGSSYAVEETMASPGGTPALFNAIQVLVPHGAAII